MTNDKQTTNEERTFLQGPQPRGSELWRAVRIFFEFIAAFRKLHFVGPCVTVFGSARFAEGHRYYELACETGRQLAEAGFTVMTGGGPGLMEAANRGAKEAGGSTVGCSIDLPVPQPANHYLDVALEFKHFFVRKVMLVKYSYAFIALPGGYGTLDEIFEAATLVQTRKIKDFPIVLIGTEYWTPLLDVLRNTLVREGTIDENDVQLFHMTDSPQEAVQVIRQVALERFGLSYGPKMKRRWFLWE
jgi:uncharacterized protein (TIGR00730 family)